MGPRRQAPSLGRVVSRERNRKTGTRNSRQYGHGVFAVSGHGCSGGLRVQESGRRTCREESRAKFQAPPRTSHSATHQIPDSAESGLETRRRGVFSTSFQCCPIERPEDTTSTLNPSWSRARVSRVHSVTQLQSYLCGAAIAAKPSLPSTKRFHAYIAVHASTLLRRHRIHLVITLCVVARLCLAISTFILLIGDFTYPGLRFISRLVLGLCYKLLSILLLNKHGHDGTEL